MTPEREAKLRGSGIGVWEGWSEVVALEALDGVATLRNERDRAAALADSFKTAMEEQFKRADKAEAELKLLHYDPVCGHCGEHIDRWCVKCEEDPSRKDLRNDS